MYTIPVADPTTLTATEIIDLETAHSAGVTGKRPLTIVRGQGAWLWDANGNRYIDCIGGHGAASIGHSHPQVVAAISEQSGRLMLCPDSLYNDQRARLLARLAEISPAGMDRAFLCNSGTEAVEAALKFARISTGRTGIIAARMGFHGRTFGSLSATWRPQYRRPVEPLVPDFSHVLYNDLAALDAVIDDRTAAVLLEVIQGEGGLVSADPDFLQGAERLCHERAALLILDEVQTGVGRTGRWWACQHYGVTPDLMPIAKALGGGYPIGACLIGPRVNALPKGSHGSTFGGNPLACATALATLDVIEEEQLIERTAQRGAMLQEQLRSIDSPLIREVRGRGFMVGLDLRIKVTPVLKALQAGGILALPAGPTVLRLLPPLTISDDDLAHVVEAIAEVLMELKP